MKVEYYLKKYFSLILILIIILLSIWIYFLNAYKNYVHFNLQFHYSLMMSDQHESQVILDNVVSSKQISIDDLTLLAFYYRDIGEKIYLLNDAIRYSTLEYFEEDYAIYNIYNDFEMHLASLMPVDITYTRLGTPKQDVIYTPTEKEMAVFVMMQEINLTVTKGYMANMNEKYLLHEESVLDEHFGTENSYAEYAVSQLSFKDWAYCSYKNNEKIREYVKEEFNINSSSYGDDLGFDLIDIAVESIE